MVIVEGWVGEVGREGGDVGSWDAGAGERGAGVLLEARFVMGFGWGNGLGKFGDGSGRLQSGRDQGTWERLLLGSGVGLVDFARQYAEPRSRLRRLLEQEHRLLNQLLPKQCCQLRSYAFNGMRVRYLVFLPAHQILCRVISSMCERSRDPRFIRTCSVTVLPILCSFSLHFPSSISLATS